MIRWPHIGMFGKFSDCEKGLIQALNENFFLLDVLTQFAAIDFVSELPEDPENGDVYILEDDSYAYMGGPNYIMVYKQNQWVTIQPQDGYKAYIKSLDAFFYYDDNQWKALQTEVVWGDIGGNIGDQTDLINALNTKLNLTGGVLTGLLEIHSLKFPTGAGLEKVLTSDASGNASWQDAKGGGGGGAIEWQSLSNGALANQDGPLGLEYVFSQGLQQEIVAYIKIPQSYKAGKPIVLFGSFYTDANTNNYRFQLTATLLKDGVTAIASTTNQNVDTIQVACPATSTAPLGLIFNITTNGEINSIAIGVDDIIILKLQRTDTVSVTETASDINFLPQTTEITYV